MKKKLLLSLFALLAATTVRADVEINETTFPDAKFRNWVLSQEYGADGVLTASEIASVTSIDVSNKKIKSLKGIEYFTALTELYCWYNKLTSLDVSKNTELRWLHCYYNQLTSLDVSKNTKLEFLGCYSNKLTSLDLSKNTALTSLPCYQNQIKVEGMDSLVASLPTGSDRKIYVIFNEDEGNIMTTEQVAMAKAKGWVPYYYNGKLDNEGYLIWEEYTGDEPVGYIAINETNFPDANFRNWVLSQEYGADGMLTASEIASVTIINVSWKDIESLQGIEYFTALEELICNGNQLTTLDVSGCTALTYLDCCQNQLVALDLSKNTALEELCCGNNQLTVIDVSQNTWLQNLSCGDNQFASFDVSKNTWLQNLWCGGNQLTSLDVSKNIWLTKLYCIGSQLTTLDLSKNTALEELHCYQNQLAALDLSKNTALEELHCYQNQLAALDLSKNTALKELYCYGNQLSALDVSKNTALTDLSCYENPLTALDLSKNTALEWLNCGGDHLTSLDVSQNTKLISLVCYNNQLTALDVSKNTELEFLSCYQNQIKDEAMDALLASLPMTEWGGNLYVIYNENEGNVMTVDQVAAANAKGWTPYYFTGEYDEQWGNQIWEEYTGPDGIKDIDHSPLTIDHYYNLAGQRLQKMQKGINIIGGKKVLVK